MSNARPNLLREVERIVLLLENGEWTDTMPKHQLAQRLEAALHDLHDELRGDDESPGAPAAEVADAQMLAWPIAGAENAAIGWTLDCKFVEQVRETAAMGYGFSAGQEEAEAILMAALSVHPLYAAPPPSDDPGPLEKAMGAVLHLDRFKETSAEGGGVYETSDGDFVKLSEVVAAMAASKGNGNG